MFSCDLGHVFTPRHPGEFIDAEITLHSLDLGTGPPASSLLPNDEVAVREGGDLRQMCDAENLVLRCQFSEDPTHTFSDRTADTRVDLIEDEDHVAIRTPQ